jgi:hypothetical protein
MEQKPKIASKIVELILSLAGLITEAETLEPLLADRLRQISKWLSKYSPGQITSKKFILAVLEEICESSEQWLILSTGNAREKSSFLSSLELADMYWSTCLFSSWFQNIDLKQAKWLRALATNQFLPTDSKLLAKVGQAIKVGGGTFVTPLIADLAMATDLIATGSRCQPLCVQLTTQSGNYLLNKFGDWELVLKYWGIEKGLLISYNPRKGCEQDIAKVILDHCNNLPDGEYTMEQIS